MIDTLAWMLVAATLIPAHRAAARSSPRQLVALGALEAASLGLIALAAWSEPRWAMLAQEDGPIEWATFAAFVLAAGVLLVSVRKRGSGRWFQAACVLLALFCVTVAGEEISWGQRLFGFKPPEVFLDRNFQQEFNVHNVLMHEGGLGFKLQSKHLVMAIALSFGLLWPALVRLRPLRVFAELAPPFALAPIALAIWAVQVSYPVDLTGEGAELMCGMFFLASAILATEASANRVAQTLAAPLFAGIVIAVVMARVVFGADDAGRAAAQAELAQLQTDVLAGTTARLENRSIHKRVFTAARDGYLRLSGGMYLEGQGTPGEGKRGDPALRHDRRGYFLDPWNNPYWIYVGKRTRDVALYSFGPNRRRDVVARDRRSNPGDDIIVRFNLVKPAAPAAPSVDEPEPGPESSESSEPPEPSEPSEPSEPTP
ncbi:MAG: hypothetical protein R3B48_29750 [Kofleriaceae bacterium]